MSARSSSRTDRSASSRNRRTVHGKSEHRIGDVTRLTGLSADTLRYYEKIGLLPPVNRTASGIRIYAERDLSRLRFIQRAQKMNFTLAEIADLLKMREDPQRARKGVRALTAAKLDAVEDRLREITTLRNELRLLLNLCRASADGCPIIDTIDRRSRKRGTPGRRPAKR